jgi:hypothetical protein
MSNFKLLKMHCKKYGLVAHYYMLGRLYRIYNYEHVFLVRVISEELLNTMEKPEIEKLVVECALERME